MSSLLGRKHQAVEGSEHLHNHSYHIPPYHHIPTTLLPSRGVIKHIIKHIINSIV